MKEAMVYKYSLIGDKVDKNWILVIKSINAKGRGIKHQSNLLEKIKNKFGIQ